MIYWKYSHDNHLGALNTKQARTIVCLGFVALRPPRKTTANMATFKFSRRQTKKVHNNSGLMLARLQTSRFTQTGRWFYMYTHSHTDTDLWWGVMLGPTKKPNHNRGLYGGDLSCLLTCLRQYTGYLLVNINANGASTLNA